MRKIKELFTGAILLLGIVAFAGDSPLGKYSDFSKWSASNGAKIELSSEYKTTGENCAMITIDISKKYSGIILENKSFDLSPFKTLTFDCFNPSKAVRCVMKFKAAGKSANVKFTIPAGKSKVKINLPSGKLDLAAVKYIKLWTKKSADKVVLFIDNPVFE